VVLLPVEVVACRSLSSGSNIGLMEYGIRLPGVARQGALLGDTTSMAAVSSVVVGSAKISGRVGVSLLMPSALRVVCAICLLRSGCSCWSGSGCSWSSSGCSWSRSGCLVVV
jgi:hypothetical protein